MQQLCVNSPELVSDCHAQFAFESVYLLPGSIVQSEACRDERGCRQKAIRRVDRAATGTKLLGGVILISFFANGTSQRGLVWVVNEQNVFGSCLQLWLVCRCCSLVIKSRLLVRARRLLRTEPHRLKIPGGRTRFRPLAQQIYLCRSL